MIVGVLGGGQLGRMLALAGIPLGLQFRFLDPSPDACAGEVGELVVGDYQDRTVLDRFCDGVSVVTYEFENVPLDAASYLQKRVPVVPGTRSLEVAQDRLTEKEMFRAVGVPTARFFPVDSLDDLRAAFVEVGGPAILKTRRLGYDGKGQALIESEGAIEAVWSELGGQPLILEEKVMFARELSIIMLHGLDGQIMMYPLAENHHKDGILRLSLAPAPAITLELQSLASRIGNAVLRATDHVGILAIELFQVPGGFLANEIAPRVHNSGHWTIDGAETSQFENHLRAILGLPLGDVTPRGRSAMINFIGALPEIKDVAGVPGAHAHYYGKEPRPGRKVGHVTVVGSDEVGLIPKLTRLQRLPGATSDATL